MGRMYMGTIVVAAHAAQVDYFELLAGSGRPILVHGFQLGQISEVGDAAEEGLELRLKYAVGGTSGSGGTPVTPTRLTPNDAATTAVLETGNTMKYAAGTVSEFGRFGWNIRGDLLWLPPPEGRPIINGGDRLVLEEATTPGDSITGPYGWILYEELV